MIRSKKRAVHESDPRAVPDTARARLKGNRASKWRLKRVAGPFQLTEGPVWTGDAVLFTDIPADRIMRYTPATGRCTELHTGTLRTNGLALDRDGYLYGCQGLGRRIVRYEPDVEPIVLADSFDGARLNGPSDLTVDSRGRIWFSDPRRYTDDMDLDHGSVYRLDPAPDGTYEITRATIDTEGPNGVALSPDERTLYLAESPQPPHGPRQLRAYVVRSDGSLDSMRVLHDFGAHRGADGLCVDAAGRILVACGSRRSGPGPRIAVFAPTGELLEEQPLKEEPTNLCFGGTDGTDVYVTTKRGTLLRASAPNGPASS